MIVKDLDPYQAESRAEQADRRAEEQMAHYLRRAFADDPRVLVFNGIRLVAGEDAAQIDHLILHPYGLIIIESKSLTTRLKVNAQGEWTRWFNGAAHGMPSPILQAERQRDFLRASLQRDPAVLAGKDVAINVRVAISDSGIIDRPRGVLQAEMEQAVKADQIPANVRETISARKLTTHVPRTVLRLVGAQIGVQTGDALTSEDLERMRAFLLAQHRPLQRAAHPEAAQIPAPVTPPSAVPASVSEALRCAKCRSTRVQLEYRFNYFLRCQECRGASPLVLRCAGCGATQGDIKRPDTFSDRGIMCIRCRHCGQPVPVDVTRTLPPPHVQP